MINIAIDGPSAAGKSATAKGVAKELNILHLNTGALYRAIGVYILENNLDINNERQIKKHLKDINITVEFNNNTQQTILNGVNISEKLNNTIIAKYASINSSYKSVRKKMLNIQRDIAKKQNVIMEGRDITSHVLPKAKYKFYITASPETRAMRRHKDLRDSGEDIKFETVLADIKDRDYRDTNRKLNPLVKVKDAILINTDNYTLKEVIDLIVAKVKE